MYHELTVWSRGIIMDKEARDVSSCVAAAARALGYYADNVSDYVDDPDRTNCLVRRYARFGDSPIVDRFVYENPHPDWVVLVEETIIKAVNFLRGTPDRGGVVVVNSVRDPHYLLKFLPDEMKAKIAKFVVVDAVGLADQRGRSPWMFVRNLSELALDRMSTEGAEERLAIGLGIAAPIIGRITAFHPPGGHGVRVDTAAYQGYLIPPYYDSLIAKLIVSGRDREEAMARGRRALPAAHRGHRPKPLPIGVRASDL